MSKSTTKSSLPVIDWDKAIRLAGNKQELAKDLLQFLKTQLLQDVESFKLALRANDFERLQKDVHKLHGAVCYCGLPKLEQSLAQLEAALKQQDLNHVESLTLVVIDAAREVIALPSGDN